MNDDQLDLGASFNTAPPAPGAPSAESTLPAPGTPAGEPGARVPSAGAVSPKRTGERVPVSKLTPGSAIEGIYLLSSKETRQTKAGKPFFKLKLGDRTGTVDCTVWETATMDSQIKVGDLVCITARVTEYQGKPQLDASKISPAAPGSAEPRDFLPCTYRDTEELKGFLRFHIESVRDPDHAALLQAIFGDPGFYEIFTMAPAAKLYHHAYLGGLMEHTVAVADLCDFIGQQYGRVDRDLLMTAALLHDVGKTRELAFETTIDFTDTGRLLGHVIQGVTLVSEKAKDLPSFPEAKLQQLLHCIVSHHGELEWGSPKRPKTIEALILHHVDNLDAKVKGFLEIVEGSRDAPWTDLRNLFRRPLHVPRAAHQEEDFLPPSEG